MKVSISNPSVPPHVKQNAQAYVEANQLKYFYTSFLHHPKYFFSNLLYKIAALRTDLNRRRFEDVAMDKIKTRPIPELLRSLASRKLNPTITDSIWEWAELGFDKWVSKRILKDKPDVIHVYEHCGLSTLTVAKKNNIFCVYEQISQHHIYFNQLLNLQLEQYPVLQTKDNTLLINDKAKRRNARRDAEIAISDLIICNSSFTKNTLIYAGFGHKNIQVIPLGFPKPSQAINPYKEDRPVRFLYAGSQSIRKGTHLLIQAWIEAEITSNMAELWLIGQANQSLYQDFTLPENIINYGNIPHEELMTIYAQTDVFILPTLADGFGMVITEAMSQGVPVITTENSCGPDIIEHQVNGWLIEHNNIQSLKNTLLQILNNKENLNTIKQAALNKSASWQWSDYRKSLTKLIETEWKKDQKKQSVL